jgi:hypothetical protein
VVESGRGPASRSTEEAGDTTPTKGCDDLQPVCKNAIRLACIRARSDSRLAELCLLIHGCTRSLPIPLYFRLPRSSESWRHLHNTHTDAHTTHNAYLQPLNTDRSFVWRIHELIRKPLVMRLESLRADKGKGL